MKQAHSLGCMYCTVHTCEARYDRLALNKFGVEL